MLKKGGGGCKNYRGIVDTAASLIRPSQVNQAKHKECTSTVYYKSKQDRNQQSWSRRVSLYKKVIEIERKKVLLMLKLEIIKLSLSHTV